MSTPTHRRPLRLTDADREAWAAYERSSARAADQFDAMPISYRNNGRIATCPECRCYVPATGLCRWCRKGAA
jgi:hypothetical protein